MVSPIAPLFQWKDGKLRSPAEVAREQQVAEALMSAQPQATGFWGALGQVGNAAVGSVVGGRADEAETQGREAASNLFAGLGSGTSTDSIAAALMSPEAAWATPAQSSVASALLESNMRQQDPAYQMDLAYKQAQIAAMEREAAMGPGGQETFFAPTMGTINGEPAFVQFGNRGSVRPAMDLPEGFTPQSRFEKVDLGTEWLITDTTTGETRREPKDIRGVEVEQAIGAAEGAAVAGAAGDLASAEMALNLIGQIKNHPSKQSATGPQAAWGWNDAKNPFNTGGAGFQRLVDQTTSGAFLTAIGEMRGLGALSNAEGQTATQAVTRLNTALEDDEFDAALADYEAVVQKGADRARRRVRVLEDGTEVPMDGGQPVPQQPALNIPSASPRVRVFNPETGRLE